MTHWFRFYDEAINDPKVLRLSDELYRAWTILLCLTSKNGGDLPPADDIALALRMKLAKVCEWLTKLHAGGLLDKTETGFQPHNWNGRQYKSDGSTERVKRFRERKRNVSETSKALFPKQDQSRSRSRSRTDAEQSRADARADQTGLVEEALRASLRKTLGDHIDLSRVSDWIGKGYDSGMVCEVVGELHRRKPDIASLAYFDAALADRHARRVATPSERAGCAAADYDKVIAMWLKTGLWSRQAGPEPGMGGCRAPVDLLAKYGIDAKTSQRISVPARKEKHEQ